MPGRVLVFDPAVQNRIALKASLAREYFDVTAVADVEDLPKQIRDHRPDVLILALDALRAEGFGSLDQIRTQSGGGYIPVLLFHRSSDTQVWADCARLRADEALAYDTPRRLLAQRLNQLVRVKEKIDATRARHRALSDMGFAEASEAFPPNHPQALTVDLHQAGLDATQQAEVRTILRRSFHIVTVIAAPGARADVTVLSEGALGTDAAGRALVAFRNSGEATASRLAPGGVLLLTKKPDAAALQRGIDLGAQDVARLDLSLDELAVRLCRLGWLRHFSLQADQSLSQHLQAAQRDALTGLYNRRYTASFLSRLSQQSPDLSGVTVMMVDLDNFKQVNDRFGHAAGDAVLQETARRLSANVRGSDLVARLGGEEFLLVLLDTSADLARRIAERLRQQIALTPMSAGDGLAIPVSASIGVSQAGDRRLRDGIDALIEDADRALYAAKGAGRNRVSFATDKAA